MVSSDRLTPAWCSFLVKKVVDEDANAVDHDVALAGYGFLDGVALDAVVVRVDPQNANAVKGTVAGDQVVDEPVLRGVKEHDPIT